MLLAVIAWLIAATCIGIGARRLKRIATLGAEAAALLADLRKARRPGQQWSDYPRIARELGPALTANSSAESVAAWNERLGDVARELAVGAEVPAVSARVGLFGGVILAVVELSRTLGDPSGAALGASGAALAAGLTAGAVGYDMDRRARKEAERVRAAWNGISSLVSPGSGMAKTGRGENSP